MPYTTFQNPSRTPPVATGGCGCGCSSCDTCDSLQCLCRPRFFAGQLVTDADFRRLDQYLVGKDRLHNKFLHGTGVVCGLEVVCNPCDDTVTVRPGYALGPCGEDIVVCADTSVDVGAMIRAQRQAQARVDCGPSSAFNSKPGDCDALEQRWILGICYDEQPGRPVTSLTTGSCSSSCNCGGNGTAVKATPVGCEPTVICEGFRFTLTKEKPATRVARGDGGLSHVSSYLPTPGNDAAVTQGALADRVRQCLTMLAANITSLPQNPSPADLVAYCCQLKDDLRTIIASGNIHDCTLGQRLNDIRCPDPQDKDAAQQATQAITDLLKLAIDLYRECICSALLPPCPNDCADDCVPIATLTVRSSDLHVLEVCNWDSRKFAVTLPMLGYWLGWLPIGATLRRLVSTLCCGTESMSRFTLGNKLNVEDVALRRAAGPSGESEAFAAPLRMAERYAGDPSPIAGFEATLLRAVGATGAEGADLATPDELANPFAAAALSRLLGPAGLDLGRALGNVTARTADEPAEQAATGPDNSSRLADLEQAVESLQRTVRSQARTITNLRKGQSK